MAGLPEDAPEMPSSLRRDTGPSRNYGQNPYPGYDDVNTSPFLFEGRVDGRLSTKERVVGIGFDRKPVAVLTSALAKKRVIRFDLAGEPVTVWWKPSTASVLEARSGAAGPDVGATGVFRSVLDGWELTFTPDGDGFVDDATESRWDIVGAATSGSFRGRPLDQLAHVDTFWFA